MRSFSSKKTDVKLAWVARHIVSCAEDFRVADGSTLKASDRAEILRNYRSDFVRESSSYFDEFQFVHYHDRLTTAVCNGGLILTKEEEIK